MFKLTIKWIDATNYEGYWIYNECINIAEITIHESSTNDEFKKEIKKYLPKMDYRKIKWSFEGDYIEILERKTNKPIFAVLVEL
jgi:hypothetical protein